MQQIGKRCRESTSVEEKTKLERQYEVVERYKRKVEAEITELSQVGDFSHSIGRMCSIS